VCFVESLCCCSEYFFCIFLFIFVVILLSVSVECVLFSIIYSSEYLMFFQLMSLSSLLVTCDIITSRLTIL